MAIKIVGGLGNTGHVDQESQRVQLIGAGMDNLSDAAAYFQALAQAASNGADVVDHLDQQIARATTALKTALRGHDSFDALAFLRLAVGPWDFTGFKESETVIETSLAA